MLMFQAKTGQTETRFPRVFGVLTLCAMALTAAPAAALPASVPVTGPYVTEQLPTGTTAGGQMGEGEFGDEVIPVTQANAAAVQQAVAANAAAGKNAMAKNPTDGFMNSSQTALDAREARGIESELLGASAAMVELRSRIERAAKANATVLNAIGSTTIE